MAAKLSPVVAPPMVPAAPTDRYEWGTMTWLLSDTDRAEMGITVAKMQIAAGGRGGAHRHTNASETVIVETGIIDLKMTILRVRLAAGEHHVIPAGQAHEVINVGGEDAELTVIYSHPERDFHATDWISEKKARRTKQAGSQRS